MKEIRTFVAHEIYRTQKRIDTAYKSYDQYKSLLKGFEGQMTDEKTKSSKLANVTEVRAQLEAAKNKLRQYQSKYKALKEIRSNLQRLQIDKTDSLE